MKPAINDALTIIGLMIGSTIIFGLMLIGAVAGYGWLWHRMVGG